MLVHCMYIVCVIDRTCNGRTDENEYMHLAARFCTHLGTLVQPLDNSPQQSSASSNFAFACCWHAKIIQFRTEFRC